MELREVLHAVEADLGDEGGLVEPETLERFGLTAVRMRTRVRTLLHRHAPDEDELPASGLALLTPRIGAGAAAGLLVLVGLEALGPAPPFSSALAGLAAGGLVAALPRIGWILSPSSSAAGWARPTRTVRAPPWS